MKRTVAGLAAVLVLACASRPQNIRTLTPPDGQGLDGRAPYLKVHLKDGRLYVLSDWRVDEQSRTVTGTGEVLGPDRRVVYPTGEHSVTLDLVALFETNVVPRSDAMASLAVMTGISAAVTAGCIVMPKACFGSCPTFCTDDGGAGLLEAEGLSTSVSPALEQTDVDSLFRARPRGRRFEIVMRNEALETHVVRHAHVLAAPRPPGGRVVATQDAAFHEVTAIRPPESCRAAEGDCLAAVRAVDGVERVSRTDGRDLATRETIDLTFPAGSGATALLIGTRQTLLTTYLFYETLAAMGPEAPAMMAALERGGPALVDQAHAVRDLLGGIEVLVPEAGGGWTAAGQVHEVGPLAPDVKVVPLPAGRSADRVRLRLTRGHWRLDYVAVGRLGAAVTPERLRPVEVVREGVGRIGGFDRGPVVARPGDTHHLVYDLPVGRGPLELFLESRGYYLEWLRREWIAAEDPRRLMQILWDPRQALIDLAPAFHAQEDAGEAAFWGSRYAVR
jgi:hypothetical protein